MVSDVELSGKKAGRKIEAHTFFSQYLHEERTIKVFLPPDYDSARPYPIMYCHDGLEFFTHGRIATIANQMILEGTLKPMLVAGIAVSKTNRNDDYGIRGSRHDAYCRFVVNECMWAMEETYNLNPKERFMAGISLGGTVSVSLSLQYPHLFSNLLLFSGAFFPSVQEHVKKVADLSFLNAYMVVGKQETAVETTSKTIHNFYGYNQQMLDILRTQGANVTYKEGEGTHVWGFWQKQLPEALMYVNQLIR
jgi:enterochelin esterase-like enzyme